MISASANTNVTIKRMWLMEDFKIFYILLGSQIETNSQYSEKTKYVEL